jgi:cytochrome c
MLRTAVAAIAAVTACLVLLTPEAAPAAEGNGAAGRVLFIRQCGLCHSSRPGEVLTAPSLAGVVGRKAGSVKGFGYSPALRAWGRRWDAPLLDAYIANPGKAVPGTNMSFAGQPDPARRADLIAYLASLR